VLSWGLFGYYWGLVAQRRITDNTVRSIQILLVLVLIIWALTGLWIQHNRRRFAGREDRRTRRAAIPDDAVTDAIGQVVHVAHATDLTSEAIIEVDVRTDTDPESGYETRRKTFRAAPLPAGGRAQ
jgi:hypothetical protein